MSASHHLVDAEWPPGLVPLIEADARNAQEQEVRERIYRQAYRDGFLAGANALEELQRVGQVSRQDAYDTVWTFWEGGLMQWLKRSCHQRITPPELPASRAFRYGKQTR